MKRLKSWLFLLCLCGVGATQATTLTGTTTVELTAAGLLASNGVAVQPVGTATLSGATAVFPITGGTLNGADALIEHDGSGLTLSRGTDHLLLLNFLIDTAAGQVFGDGVLIDDVNGVPSALTVNDIPLFDLGTATTGGIPLLLTAAAAGALSSLFALPDLTGAQIGLASPAVSAVPVPAAVWLMGSALAGLGLLRRRA